MRKEYHPLLRGNRGDSKYKHGFSAAEMESLKSMCEAVLPSLPLDSLKNRKVEGEPSRAIQSFWTISASQYSVPQEVAGTRVKGGLIEAVLLVRVILWLLAIKFGAFLLCGFLCVSNKWLEVLK